MSYTNMPRQPRMTQPRGIPQGQRGGHNNQMHAMPGSSPQIYPHQSPQQHPQYMIANMPGTQMYHPGQQIAPAAGYAQVPQYYLVPSTAAAVPDQPGVYYSQMPQPQQVNMTAQQPAPQQTNQGRPPSQPRMGGIPQQPTGADMTQGYGQAKTAQQQQMQPNPYAQMGQVRMQQPPPPQQQDNEVLADHESSEPAGINLPISKLHAGKLLGSAANGLIDKEKINFPEKVTSSKPINNASHSAHSFELSRDMPEADGGDQVHSLAQEIGTKNKLKSKSYDHRRKPDTKEHTPKLIEGKAEIDIRKLVEEHLSCPICMEVVQLRMPPCQHFICKACIDNIKRVNRGQFSCPSCGEKNSGDFPVSRVTENILDTITSSRGASSSTGIAKDDEICELRNCDRHIDRRCLKCNKYLCYRCSRLDCKQNNGRHDCQEIQELQKTAEGNFEAWKTRLTTRQLHCQTKIEELLAEIAENKSLLDYAEQTWEAMKNSVTGRINFIDELGETTEKYSDS